MKKDIPYRLLAKYFAGECSDKEIEEIESWKAENASNRSFFEEYLSIWNSTSSENVFHPDVEQGLNAVNRKIEKEEDEGIFTKKKPTRYFVFRIAAVLVVAALAWLTYQVTREDKVTFRSGNEIAEMTFPDGSRVILNRNSTVTYPEKFGKNSRKVELSGEAFFEVTKDPEKPFSIEAQGSVTTVLGTAFNLRAVPGEEEVTLAVTEGKVSFSSKKTGKSVQISRGEKATFFKVKLEITSVKSFENNNLSWKYKKLDFTDIPLKEVLSQMEDMYGVPVSSSSADTIRVTLEIPAGTPVEDALQALSFITGTTVSRSDEGYILKK